MPQRQRSTWSFEMNVSTVPAQPRSPSTDIPRWHALRAYADMPQGRIAYHDIGEGPAVLLIHGFPLNAFQWRDVIAGLAPARRCIAPDLLGLGYSRPSSNADLSMTGQARMLVDLIDRLAIPAVDLIANDSGTGVAQILAAHHGERVRSMLLTNGDVEPDCPPEPLIPVIDLARQGGFARAMIGGALADLAAARSATGIVGLTYTEPGTVTDEVIRTYFDPLVESPERVALTDAYASSLAPNSLRGLEPRLSASAPPTAIVWGMADIFFKPSDIEYLLGILPKVRLVERVEGAKLFFPEEHPKLIVQCARTLWASLRDQ